MDYPILRIGISGSPFDIHWMVQVYIGVDQEPDHTHHGYGIGEGL